MVKAYAYLRVSSKGQVEGDGFPRQEAAILDYAEKHGFEIAGFFKEEGVSGTTEDRPTLAKMMIDLEDNGHGIKTVIVEKLDRLARDLMVQEAIIRDFKRGGFNLVSSLEGADLLENDPTRKLIRQVFGAVAEYEKQMLVAKLRAARERKKAKTGKCGGRNGYRELNPDVLVMIHKLKNEGFSLLKIADEMNKRGFKPLIGEKFTSTVISNILTKERKRNG